MCLCSVFDIPHRSATRDEFGTQRVYKKTSPNCVLTLYLPTREMTLTGDKAAVLRGILYVDPKAIQGYRVYAQLTLTFRYGREDEEVMGLRFCNEAIMSLHQIWPRLQEPAPDSLSPLQVIIVIETMLLSAHTASSSSHSYCPLHSPPVHQASGDGQKPLQVLAQL
ncbi:blast:Arrestin%2C lateral eye [Drosophila guanche]|uniref:Blast:Arrestin, lateral eye n=1 Tax=Drosophila guanche TaxID=7266 RepID=A0A3B0KRI3_DROGU|nr:blast:Arrestin%2C lateral eye [Drosophila guanche]